MKALWHYPSWMSQPVMHNVTTRKFCFFFLNATNLFKFSLLFPMQFGQMLIITKNYRKYANIGRVHKSLNMPCWRKYSPQWRPSVPPKQSKKHKKNVFPFIIETFVNQISQSPTSSSNNAIVIGLALHHSSVVVWLA